MLKTSQLLLDKSEHKIEINNYNKNVNLIILNHIHDCETGYLCTTLCDAALSIDLHPTGNALKLFYNFKVYRLL